MARYDTRGGRPMSELLQALSGVVRGRQRRARAVPVDDTGAERQQRATRIQSGTARAAVLGINDGLVTNLSLILGVVGGNATPAVVQLAGLASLIAGAGSMAGGEDISLPGPGEQVERGLLGKREGPSPQSPHERGAGHAAVE